jgi:Replication protein
LVDRGFEAAAQAGEFLPGPAVPLCNWRRSLKLKHQLRQVLDAIGVGVTHKTLMLTLTEPNSEAETFAGSIDRLLEAFNRLTKRRRWKRAEEHRLERALRGH